MIDLTPSPPSLDAPAPEPAPLDLSAEDLEALRRWTLSHEEAREILACASLQALPHLDRQREQ